MSGSRDFTDGASAAQALVAVVSLLDCAPNPVLVHGAARGLDTAAPNAAQKLGWATEAHLADWNAHGGFLKQYGKLSEAPFGL